MSSHEPALDPEVLFLIPFLLAAAAVVARERRSRAIAVGLALLVTGSIALLAFSLALSCQDSFSVRCEYTRQDDEWLIAAGFLPVLSALVMGNYERRRPVVYGLLAGAIAALLVYVLGFADASPTDQRDLGMTTVGFLP